MPGGKEPNIRPKTRSLQGGGGGGVAQCQAATGAGTGGCLPAATAVHGAGSVGADGGFMLAEALESDYPKVVVTDTVFTRGRISTRILG